MKNKIITCFFCIFLLFSCSKKEDPLNKKIDPKTTGALSDLPAWVIDPNIEGTVAGVGISPDSVGGIKIQIAKAELDAKANISSSIYTEITRITKNALRSAKVNEESDDVDDFFAQATKEVVKDFPLFGVKRINIFKDKEDGTLYIHMALSKEDYSKFLNRGKAAMNKMLKKSNLAHDNIKKGEEATKILFEELEKERESKIKPKDVEIKNDEEIKNKDLDEAEDEDREDQGFGFKNAPVLLK